MTVPADAHYTSIMIGTYSTTGLLTVDDFAVRLSVPPPLAKALGEIILTRHEGIDMPATDSRFTRWLRRHGKSPATARKMKSGVVQARRFLGGRLYSDSTRELAALEQSTDFQALSGSRRSALRRAVALYAEYLDHKAKRDVLRRNRANQAALTPLTNEQ